MSELYVKGLSELTGVSIQTLHHYDRIGLFRPSVRLENGYQSYTEEDQKKLEKTLALRSFGLDLTKIKKLMKNTSNSNSLEYLTPQVEAIKKQIETLQEVYAALSKDYGF